MADSFDHKVRIILQDGDRSEDIAADFWCTPFRVPVRGEEIKYGTAVYRVVGVTWTANKTNLSGVSVFGLRVYTYVDGEALPWIGKCSATNEV